MSFARRAFDLGGYGVPRTLAVVPNPRRHTRPSRVTSLDSRLGHRGTRLIGAGLAAVVLLGAGAASAASHHPVPRPQVAAVRLSAEVGPSPVALPAPPKPVRKAAAHRRTSKRAAHHAVTATKRVRVTRWLPTGTGMWLHEYTRSQGGNGRAIVARARQVGLTALYVRTGSSHDGWIGTPTLRSLLPATVGTSIKVIAWDFPTLDHPVDDARRLARAATFHCGGCPRVAAVAPDVETAAEGTHIGDAAVARYYTTLRRLLPPEVAILATVPWPSELRTGRYPYARTAALSDALMPMAYWYNRSPALVTTTSMRYLKRFKRPIMPVGQGYDGRLDVPWLRPDRHPGMSVRAFVVTAKRGGAAAISLWSWQTTGPQQWGALRQAHALFSGPVARHRP